MDTDKDYPLLANGLQRHMLVMGMIAALLPERKELVIEIGRLNDELIAAAIMDNLLECDTPEKRAVRIQLIYDRFRDRWVPNDERRKKLEKLL